MSDSYFSSDAVGEATAPGRYVDVSALPVVTFAAGLEFRPVTSETTMLSFVHFEPHSVAPRHAHAEEQIVLILDGELEFDLDGDIRIMRKGDVAVIPPWVPHGARTLDRSCDEVDVFNPPRQSMLSLVADLQVRDEQVGSI